MSKLLQLPDGRPPDDGLADVIVQYQQLTDSLAPPVTGAPAMFAALAFAKSETGRFHGRQSRLIDQFPGRHGCLAALYADDTYESLREYARQRRYETVGIHSHVQEAAYHVKHVVGMHRGKHEMAGQCRLNRDLCSLRIANLTHHDLVRIVAQNGAQAAREGQPLLLIDRNLQYAGQLVFDGIFDRHDL